MKQFLVSMKAIKEMQNLQKGSHSFHIHQNGDGLV